MRTQQAAKRAIYYATATPPLRLVFHCPLLFIINSGALTEVVVIHEK